MLEFTISADYTDLWMSDTACRKGAKVLGHEGLL